MRYISLAILVCFMALGFGIVGCSNKGQVKTVPNKVAKKNSTHIFDTDKQTDESDEKNAEGREIAPEARISMAEQLGMPVYPEAKNKDFSNGTDSNGSEIVVASFTSRDGFDTVMAFYREKLKGYTESEEKLIEGSRFSGFRQSSGKDSSLIVIESPGKNKPTKIDVTVTRAAKKK